ncbi:hypothetical protein NQ318_021904 [Aromia moschata]|uniref:Uncharacterized protein n=1 Tax=Aromia moschata TaxID=1265417 RepID=A0AAV8Z8E4_9CUCU|nr:hypothetical protein NQ318_021904 [Aromia moschata]
MLSVQMEQRVNLNFLFKLGKTFRETYKCTGMNVYTAHKFLNSLNGFKRDVKRPKTILVPDGPRRQKRTKTLKKLQSRMNVCADILNNIDTDPGLITCDESLEAVKAKATEVLNQLREVDFQHCFQQWKSRMERCRDRQGEYIEGEKVATLIELIGPSKMASGCQSQFFRR